MSNQEVGAWHFQELLVGLLLILGQIVQSASGIPEYVLCPEQVQHRSCRQHMK